MQYRRNCKGNSLQIFRICFFCNFLQLNNFKSEFSPEVGVIRQSKEKTPAPPPKIDHKCRFPSDDNLMCNFKSGDGLTDPKSVCQDIKLILKSL